MSKIFRSLPSATAETYAANSTSVKLLDNEQNAVLFTAARGEAVDVVEFRKAATAALSAAATRAGSSPGRREYTKMARHLIYWADAIIEGALDELPTFEPGERSRKVQELQDEVARLRALVDETSTSVSNASTELNTQVTRAEVLKAKVDRVESDNRVLIDRNNHLEKTNTQLAARLGRVVFAVTGGEE